MFSQELARQILAIHFQPADHARYTTLSAKAQEGNLSSTEQDELDDYLKLNDLLIIMKAKAEALLRHNE